MIDWITLKSFKMPSIFLGRLLKVINLFFPGVYSGMTRQTWRSWRSVCGRCRWMGCCGEPPNWFLWVTASRNCRSTVWWRTTRWEQTSWRRRSPSLRTTWVTSHKLCALVFKCHVKLDVFVCVAGSECGCCLRSTRSSTPHTHTHITLTCYCCWINIS